MEIEISATLAGVYCVCAVGINEVLKQVLKILKNYIIDILYFQELLREKIKCKLKTFLRPFLALNVKHWGPYQGVSLSEERNGSFLPD